MITAGDIRKGVIFDDGTSKDPKNPNLFLVVDFQHVKPGKGAAFVRTKLKNVITGQVIERTYNPSEKIDDIQIERREMQYLYNEGGLYYFMDNETYEQIPFNYDTVEDAMKFMIEADNINHPSEKALFDCVYNSLDISNEEGLSIMNYFKDAQNDMVISLKNHLSTISSWNLDKKKNLISILTVMATIDKNIDERESKLLTQYRITCGLSYEDYSMLEAMQDAKKYIIK